MDWGNGSDRDGEGSGRGAGWPGAGGPGAGGLPEGGEGLDLEAQAVEAAAWFAGCREAAARGEPDSGVGAAGIVDPVLGGLAAEFEGVVDRMVAFDPVCRDGKDLLEYVVGLETQMARLVSVAARTARAYEVSGEWVLKGRTAAARLAHRCRVSTKKVNAQVRLGRSLAGMPVTEAALSVGEISEDHATKLAGLASCERTAEAFEQDEEDLVDFARELGWRAFCDKLAGWRLRVDPDGAEDNAAADEANRRVHLSSGIDGTGILNGILAPYGHAVVKAALDRVYEHLLEEDKADARERLGREPSFLELARTPIQRRHDALVRMAELSQQTDVNGRRPAPLVSIVLGRDSFTDVVARIENTDTIVPPGVVARIFDDHHGEVLIERIIFDGPNRVVDVSDRRRFTGKLRRAIEVRDRTCAWPGCDTPAVACQIDHIVEHTEGGTTSQDNGQALCKAHNLIKERTRKLMARRHPQRGP